MSDLMPEGIKVVFGGQEREILLTVKAIEEIQSACNMSLHEAMIVMANAADGKTDSETLEVFKAVAAILLSGDGEKVSTEDVTRTVSYLAYRKLARIILGEYGISIPEPDEDEDDEDEEDDSPNVETGR